MPVTFYGIGLDYSTILNKGSFNLAENEIPCCLFDEGSGAQYGFSLNMERWLNGVSSINYFANFSIITSKFEIDNKLPTREGNFETKYIFNSTLYYIGLGISYKIRVPEINLNFVGGLSLMINLSNKQIHTELALTDNVPFSERILTKGKINDINIFLINPFIAVNTDLDMGVGMYASPSFTLLYNVNSILSDESWHGLGFNLGVKIYRAF